MQFDYIWMICRLGENFQDDLPWHCHPQTVLFADRREIRCYIGFMKSPPVQSTYAVGFVESQLPRRCLPSIARVTKSWSGVVTAFR